MTASEPHSSKLNLLAEQSDEQDAYGAVSSLSMLGAYQSEAELERQFIRDLECEGYEQLILPKGTAAIENFLYANLRTQLTRLNRDKLVGGMFTDSEWQRMRDEVLLNPKETIADRSRMLRSQISFELDTGQFVNLVLLADDPNDNSCQVISQVENESGHSKNRYDVTLLVNGLPLGHAELKRRGVSLEEAFKQINRYRKESFWASSSTKRAGLYSWTQVFIASNGTDTIYWSNTAKELSRKNQNGEDIKLTKTPGFELVSHWADKSNRTIHDLGEFVRTFLSRRQFGKLLKDYCVVDSLDRMKVLRPYQVHAIEAALGQLKQKATPPLAGMTNAGGYIWHTTGSGKTLTSFVLAQIIARQQQGNSKVLFVVDRQDLDYQTKREFNSFSPDSVDGNKNTRELVNQLLDPNKPIIVTTIQKLASLAKRARTDAPLRERLRSVTDHEVVVIYDECHRSQFGSSHKAIKRLFTNHRIFGFTGTPIFPANAVPGMRIQRGRNQAVMATTEALFGRCLHAYTIVNAIDDKNVLKFKISTHTVGKEEPGYYNHPDRIAAIVEHVFANHDRLTHRRAFNAIFAAESVQTAQLYYRTFMEMNDRIIKLRAELEATGDKIALAAMPRPLRIATVYTHGANNEDETQGDLLSIDDSDLDTAGDLPSSDRERLSVAINHYNRSFGTSFTLSEFAAYKDDVARRMKSDHRTGEGDIPFQIDLLIVVNMFLTGFDAPTLNTLYVDKDLRMHGLIQAFSRTNRVLNSIKSHGEIMCYRNLEPQIDEALRLFGQEQDGQIVLLPGYEECRRRMVKAVAAVQELGSPTEIIQFKRERDKKKFVKAWTAYLRALNTVSTFDTYETESVGPAKLADRQVQDYSSIYHDLHECYVEKGDLGGEQQAEVQDDAIVFDITLLRSIEVNIDYILDLIGEMVGSGQGDDERERLRADIERHIGASATLREKRWLISDFIDYVLANGIQEESIYHQFQSFARERAYENLRAAADTHGLDFDRAADFLSVCLAQNEFLATGQSIIRLKATGTKISFLGGGRDVWKMSVERSLHDIYNEMVGILKTLT